MRNIWLLLKNYFICGIGNFRRKNTQAKTVVGTTIVLLLFIGLYALIQWMMLLTAAGMAELNMQASVLAMGLIISVFFAMMFALQTITGGKKANDIEILLSMPFKKHEIIIAKIISRFAFNFLIVTMLFLPSIIAYLVYTPFNLVAILGCVVVMFLIPLMAVGFSYLIDYFVTVCFSNSKFGNISKAIFTLLTFIGLIAIYEFFVMNMDSAIMLYVVDWIITFNPVIMLPVILGVLIIFISGIWLNALLLKRENRNSQSKPQKISNKITLPLISLLKNENNRYFNSPTLMLNTIIGPLLMVAATIWLLADKSVIPMLTTTISMIGVPAEFIYLLLGLAFGTTAILTYPSAVSISLEGKQLWILRSMPIPAKTVLTAKVLFNILLIVPLSVICTTILGIALHLSFSNFVLLSIIPILSGVLVSYTGILINLYFPKFEFENEATVIKQSLSATIMMLGGMVVNGCLIGLVIGLAHFLPFIAIALIILSILIIATGIVITLTYTVGQRIFNHL